MSISINFDRLIVGLLCAYAFFVPLELILEFYFDIETIFKPYRILALLLMVVFALKVASQVPHNRNLKQDIFLYGIIAYGLAVSFFQMMQTSFSMAHFYNDVFQMGLYLAVFTILHYTEVNRKDLHRIISFFAAGVVFNSFYVFRDFYILNKFWRHAGMMDNPNYVALSVLIIIIFQLIHLSSRRGISVLLSWLMIFYLTYIFIVAGSRTAFIVIVAGLIGVIWFTSIRQKVILASGGVLLFFVVSMVDASMLRTEGPLILFNRLEKSDFKSDPRIAAWKGLMRAAISNRFVGMGIGQFKHRFREFYYDSNDPLIQRILSRGYFLSPHSDYFALLVIYGIVGLLLYLFYLFVITREKLMLIRQSAILEDKKFHQFAIIGILSLILFGVTAENFNSAIYWLVLAVCTKSWA